MTWTTPRTWVAAETVTAALFNTHIRDNSNALGDTWASFTPTLANWTLGNGTLAGHSRQVGKAIDVEIDLTLGTTTTTVGTLAFTLPTAARIAYSFRGFSGRATIIDTSANDRRFWIPASGGAGGTSVGVYNPDGSATTTPVNATTPWTWATGDRITVCCSYEAA
jgi:hypothetical protein